LFVPSNHPVQRFEDILDNIARIEGFTAGMDGGAFVENEQALFAVKHALLIISESGGEVWRFGIGIVSGHSLGGHTGPRKPVATRIRHHRRDAALENS
jgi:hypothetical protein